MGKREARKELADLLGLPAVPPGWVTAVGNRVRAGLARARRGAAPPPVVMMESLFGLFDNRVLGLMVELGIVDALRDVRTADALARELGLDPERLDRLLRYAAARGLVAAHDAGRYGPNAVTGTLAADADPSWRGWVEFLGSDWFWQACRRLDAAVVAEPVSGIAAATGHEFFEYVHQVNPDGGRAFDAAMAAGSTVQALALISDLEWDGVDSVCDVGGGTGALTELVLRHVPVRRAWLFDLPDVVAAARPALRSGPLSTRAEIVGGDFFTDDLPPGCDRYLLLAIVHDWGDDDAVRLLGNVGRAMGASSEAVVVDSVVAATPRDDAFTATDMVMLAVAPGRERTLDQFSALADRSGLRLEGRTQLPTGFAALHLSRR